MRRFTLTLPQENIDAISWSGGAADSDPAPATVSADTVCGVLRLADFGLISACGTLSYWTWLTGIPSLDWSIYALLGMFGALLAINAFQLVGVYRLETLGVIRNSLKRVSFGWCAVIGLLVITAFLTKTSDQFSRVWLILWCAFSGAALCVSRVILYFSILDWKSEGKLRRDIVVFGLGPVGQRFISHLTEASENEYRIVGAFDDRVSRTPDFCWGVPMMGNLDAMIDTVRRRPVDMIVVTLPLSAEERLADIFEKLKAVPVDVRLCPDAVGFRLDRIGISRLGDVPLLNVIDRPLAGWRWSVKTLEDRVLATLILLMAMPLMMVISLVIKLDSPGPVLFRQKRYGYNNQLIEVMKFRTMYDDQKDENAEKLTQRNDPRVTRIGAFLRKSSLDELPQVFNVLRGEMSIVGPRPHACRAKAGGVLYQTAVEQYESRHRVKPGITGWAQVNGWRGETETVDQIRRRVEHDLAYIENWSVALDLKIILRTLKCFTDHRAY